jgi:O-acetyl-ADP-ribose deacetylase (regulator of RNase III)
MENPIMSKAKDKTAFIIMPYGKVKDADGNEIDFELVYKDIIQEPVEAMGFKPLRCDEIQKAGSIHEDMFMRIATDDLAIVDISLLNPNVFYELGVRHALKPSITILIKNRATKIPFNIQSERIIQYPSETGSYRDSRQAIETFIKSGLNSGKPDSPIFNLLKDVNKDPKGERITQLKEYPYRLTAQPNKRLSVITGDIRKYRGIDVWVNSENTNMQMSRFYDKTLSAMIRYEGAEKDENEEVVTDTIANELAARLQGKLSVTPGAVYVTGSGALEKCSGVKKIFHAATVCGVPASGYQCIQEVEKCVDTALLRMDSPRYQADDLRSILFPMMGTGAGGKQVELVAPLLIRAAVSYLLANPNSRVEKVYFAAWNYRDLEACSAELKVMNEVEPVT